MSTTAPRRRNVSFGVGIPPPTASQPADAAAANSDSAARSASGGAATSAGHEGEDRSSWELQKCIREEADIRGKLLSTWTSATTQLMMTVLLPMSNGAIKALIRECTIAKRDATDATAALAERDAELSGLLLHQQSESLGRAELARKCEVFEKRAREAEAAAAAAQLTAASLRDELHAAERSALALRERNASLEATASNRKDEAVAAVGKVDDLRSENRDLKARIMTLENEVFSMNTMLSDTRGRLRFAEGTVKELRERNCALIDELDAVARDMGAGSPAQSQRGTTGNSGSPNAAAVAVATVRELLDAVIEAKKSELAAVVAARDIDAERISVLEASLRAVQEQHRNAAAAASSARDALDSTETMLRGAQSEVRSLEQDKARLLDQVATLSQQNRDANRLIEELTQNNKNLQREASMWERRVREGETEGNRNEGRIVQLTNEVEARARLVAHLESQCDAMTSELATTQSKLSIVTEALKETTEIIDPMREELHKNAKIIHALKEKFSLSAERHNVTGGAASSGSSVSTPRTGHYRRNGGGSGGGGAASDDELATFMEAPPGGSIVERLQDIIFAKTEEVKRLTHARSGLLKQLQDAEVTIERMTRDSKEKSEEFRRSLSQALNTFTGIGGYDTLVEGVFRAKEMHFKVASLAAEVEHEQQRYQKLLVRCRVLERHLEERTTGSNTSNNHSDDRPPQPPTENEFAARLSAILADGGAGAVEAEEAAGRYSTGSHILSLDNAADMEELSPPQQYRREPQREARVTAQATTSYARGVLFRPPSPSASVRSSATSSMAAATTGGGAAQPGRSKSDRMLALEAKMQHVDTLRRQLLDLEQVAADSTSGASRQRIFTEMDRLHTAALSTMSNDTGSRQSTPRQRAGSNANNTPSSKPLTPRSGPSALIPASRLEENSSFATTATATSSFGGFSRPKSTSQLAPSNSASSRMRH